MQYSGNCIVLLCIIAGRCKTLCGQNKLSASLTLKQIAITKEQPATDMPSIKIFVLYPVYTISMGILIENTVVL